MGEWWVGLLLFVVGVLGSALCSGLETGFYCLSALRLRLRLGADRPDAPAARVRRELDRPDRLLTTLLIWNNVFNYICSFGLAGLMLNAGLSEAWVIALQALVLTPALLVLAESLPKELFRIRADDLPYRLVGMVPIMRLSALPVLTVVLACARLVARAVGSKDRSSDSRDRIAALLKESALHGAISPVQASLIDRSIEIARTPVGQLASPLSGVVLDVADTRRVRSAARRSAPEPLVVLRSRGQVAGFIDPIAVPGDPLALLPPLRLDASATARDALAQMAAAGARSAVVVARGRDIGIVTTRTLARPLLEALRGSAASE